MPNVVTPTSDFHRWTREEYERIVEMGGFEGWNVELIDGALYDGTPQTSRHAGLTAKIAGVLTEIDPGEHLIRHHSPLAIPGDSLPEPDLAVVNPDPAGDYYVGAHPTMAVLVVEIADSSLRYDRAVKARAYAQAGIPEYWILNLVSWQLEVHREPMGNAYGQRTVLGLGDEISPLFAVGETIKVERLFPRTA